MLKTHWHIVWNSESESFVSWFIIQVQQSLLPQRHITASPEINTETLALGVLNVGDTTAANIQFSSPLFKENQSTVLTLQTVAYVRTWLGVTCCSSVIQKNK